MFLPPDEIVSAQDTYDIFFFFFCKLCFCSFSWPHFDRTAEDRREIGWEREEVAVGRCGEEIASYTGAQRLLMFSGFSGRVSVSMRAFSTRI